MIDRDYDANRVRQRLAGGGLNLPLFETQRMGIAAPQELSICGIDNHALGTETNPALTTIALPLKPWGELQRPRCWRPWPERRLRSNRCCRFNC